MKTKRFIVFCLVVLVVGLGVLVLLFLPRGGEMPGYEVVDLGMPDGSDNCVVCINDIGQVGGYIRRGGGLLGAFIWDAENGIVELPEVEGKSCYISDINNKGQVAGHIYDMGNDPNRTFTAFFRDVDGEILRLPLGDNVRATASAINDKGQVVGVISSDQRWQKGGLSKRVFIWDKNDGMRVVDGIEGTILFVAGINDAGQIAGLVDDANGSQAFVWNEKSGVVYIDVEASQIFDIDEYGNVLGTVGENEERLFIWNESDGVRMLGVEGDKITWCRMNDRGDVVGSVTEYGIELFDKFRFRDTRLTAFLYNRDGKMISFNPLFDEAEFFGPRDINNEGWVVGYFFNVFNGEYRGILLRPE